MKKALLLIALSFGLCAAAYGGYSEGVAAYAAGNYELAMKVWSPLAERGDARAQNALGMMYSVGRGVSIDDAKALKWVRKAAEQGDVEGQFNLGSLYYQGRGVVRDEKQTFEWWLKAAAQGLARAQYSVGLLYSEGSGVNQDKKQAILWFQKAAIQDFAPSQYGLGLRYASGRDVPVDKVLAYLLMVRSARSGNEGAVAYCNTLEKEMSSAQREEARALVAAWRPGKPLPEKTKTGGSPS